jgi:ABC-type dipeptide/oligopeptide/nickel transport system permease subunit
MACLRIAESLIVSTGTYAFGLGIGMLVGFFIKYTFRNSPEWIFRAVIMIVPMSLAAFMFIVTFRTSRFKPKSNDDVTN